MVISLNNIHIDYLRPLSVLALEEMDTAAFFTMGTYIHKTESMMDGAKEKMLGRDQREKTKKQKKYYSQAYTVNNMKNWKK